MKSKGRDIITLSLGEAFFEIPLLSFSNLPFPDIYHYSHSRGIIELRKCLSEYFLESYGIEINPESEILITAGSKIAIYMSLMTILNPGDFTAVKPGLYHTFEGIEDGVAFELYWAEFNHNDIQRENVGHLKEGNIVRLDKKNDKTRR